MNLLYTSILALSLLFIYKVWKYTIIRRQEKSGLLLKVVDDNTSLMWSLNGLHFSNWRKTYLLASGFLILNCFAIEQASGLGDRQALSLRNVYLSTKLELEREQALSDKKEWERLRHLDVLEVERKHNLELSKNKILYSHSVDERAAFAVKIDALEKEVEKLEGKLVDANHTNTYFTSLNKKLTERVAALEGITNKLEPENKELKAKITELTGKMNVFSVDDDQYEGESSDGDSYYPFISTKQTLYSIVRGTNVSFTAQLVNGGKTIKVAGHPYKYTHNIGDKRVYRSNELGKVVHVVLQKYRHSSGKWLFKNYIESLSYEGYIYLTYRTTERGFNDTTK